MKIYILRHEDRPQDCSFFSPLTKTGLENANKLVEVVKTLCINMVISSPFIRTLQTIYPYCKSTNTKINLEYGLSEIHHPDIIAKKSAGMTLPEYLAEAFHYNPDYKSIVKVEDITYPEIDVQPVKKRLYVVLRDLIKKYHRENINILLVTHQSLCTESLKLAKKNKNVLIPDDVMHDYKKGKLCLLFDNGWAFKEIN